MGSIPTPGTTARVAGCDWQAWAFVTRPSAYGLVHRARFPPPAQINIRHLQTRDPQRRAEAVVGQSHDAFLTTPCAVGAELAVGFAEGFTRERR